MDHKSDHLVNLAVSNADKHLLDPALVCAVVEYESQWNTFAFRPALNSITLVGETSPERWGRTLSWGLMQLSGDFARELGFSEKFLSELCKPEFGLHYGCRRLRLCLDLHLNDETLALSQFSCYREENYARMVQSLKSKFYLVRRKQ